MYGSAGEGFEWHHIVEQRSVNVERFGAERINNMVALPKSLHRKIRAQGDFSVDVPALA